MPIKRFILNRKWGMAGWGKKLKRTCGEKNEKKEKRGKRKSPLDRLKTLKNGVKTHL